jgi:hypothetical protein
MKDTGKMTYNMDMVLKLGLMGQSMKAITMKAKSMAKEHILGVMDQNMWETGLITKSMVKVFIRG